MAEKQSCVWCLRHDLLWPEKATYSESPIVDNVLTLELGWSSEGKFVVNMYSVLAPIFFYFLFFFISSSKYCLSLKYNVFLA